MREVPGSNPGGASSAGKNHNIGTRSGVECWVIRPGCWGLGICYECHMRVGVGGPSGVKWSFTERGMWHE